MSATGNTGQKVGVRAYAAPMAISIEEQKLRDETRTALLSAIKSGAEAIEANSSPGGEILEHLATAYATVCGTEKRSGRMTSV